MSSKRFDLNDLLIGGVEAEPADIEGLLVAVLTDNVDAILVVDDVGLIRAANPAAAELFGRDEADLIGSAFGGAPETGARVEIEVLRPDGAVYAEMVAGSTTWGGRAARVVTLRNVTARRRAIDALRDYVSMTAHEVATPLTSISGFTETLLTSWDELEDARKREFIGIIGRHAGRISRISRDLLALSRLDAESMEMYPERVIVAEAVDEALESVSGLEVAVDVDPHLVVEADPMHVLTILGNFLSNARKYGAPPFVVATSASANFVEVEIRDHGPGVPRDFVPHLFERFARARRPVAGPKAEGTGLGLALNVGLAELNGGTVHHRHNHPSGSVFSLVLPRATEDGDGA